MTLVVGVGNPDRGDDAVGARVVAALRDAGAAVAGPAVAGPADVELRTVVEPLDALDLWTGHDRVVIVDALEDPAAHPGSVVVLAADDARIAASAPVGTHAVSLDAVLALAARLDRLPARLRVVGVVGTCFAAGAPLSEQVAAAVPEAAAAVRTALA